MKKKNISLIVRAAHPHVWKRFLHLLDKHDLHLDKLTYEEVHQWIFKAERQPSDKSAIVALVNSIMGNSLSDTPSDLPRSNTPTATPAPTTPQDGVPAVGVPAVYMQQGKVPHATVFEGLCGPAVTATQQVRDQAARDGKCSNCFNWKNKKYPPHKADQCPYTTLDCVERKTPHFPVTPTNGRPLRASSQDRIQSLLTERASFLATQTASLQTDPIPSKTASLYPIEIKEVHEENDDDEITIPDEPPMKGPIKLSAWAASASPHRTVSHMRMVELSSAPWSTSARRS
jgi:hypothetical protein